MTLPKLSSYCPEVVELLKLAVGEMPPSTKTETDEPVTRESPSSIALKNLLAYGGGMVAGAGGGYLADKAFEHFTGKPAPFLVPATAAISGLAGNYMYNKWKAQELEQMQNAGKAKRDRAKGGST